MYSLPNLRRVCDPPSVGIKMSYTTPEDVLKQTIRYLLFSKYLDHPLPWQHDGGWRILDANGHQVMRVSSTVMADIVIEQMKELHKELEDEQEATERG